MKITSVKAIEILDSRGKPTIKTFITLNDNSVYSSAVPSGASTGSHEAVELRDNDSKRYLGFGVQKAIHNVNSIIHNALKDKEVEPRTIDEVMLNLDGTDNKKNLGANALLSVSQAIVRAGSALENVPLWKYINSYYQINQKPAFPRIMTNIINGGKHAMWNFDIQEFMIIPKSSIPSQCIRVASEIFLSLGSYLKGKKLSTLVGDEGGYSPPLHSNEEVFEVIMYVAKKLGYENGRDYDLALDCAATEFYKNNTYLLQKTKETKTGQEMAQFYHSLQKEFSIFSFEDPFSEDDWESYQYFMSLIDQKTQVVGDDLYVTNISRIQKGIDKQATNAVLIKLNQIGTVSETIDAIKLAKQASWKNIISHRSGETEDSFISDLAYGTASEFIKTGSMSRSERLAKYNRLLEIENNY